MVYKYIKNRHSRKKIRPKSLKNKIFSPPLLLLILLIVIISIFSIQDYIKLIGKTIGVGSSDDEFKAEICGEWGRCTVDYNFKDVNNFKDFDLIGIERRECLDNNKIIVQRRTCDPTISVKIEKRYGQLNVLGPAMLVGVLPSVKKTDEGVEFFEPAPGLEEEVLISRVNLYKEKGIKKLDIEIIV